MDLLILLPTAIAAALFLTTFALFAIGLVRWRRRVRAAPSRAPRVTILKPLAGGDDELADNLASFAELDYPEYDVLFGVARVSDPAYAVAIEVARRFPRRNARVVVTDPSNALNPKVAQLVDLERAATGEVIVISDSNVRVPRSYLWSLTTELQKPHVGLVTSVFVGTGEKTLGAALENLQLCAVTTPGLVATSLVSRRRLTVGKSMAMWRRDLVRLGGFASVGGVLAEDFALGRLFLAAGHRVRTTLDAVENRNVDSTVACTFARHARWAKIRRALHPAAFAFEPLLSPLATSTIVALFAPSRLALGAVVASAALQIACAAASTRLLRGRAFSWVYAPLEVLRAYVALVCWVTACVSRRVVWRGHPFVLGAGSVILPALRSGAQYDRGAVVGASNAGAPPSKRTGSIRKERAPATA